MRIPRITSAWTRIISDPHHHLNDFCIFVDRQGRWHCVGIMGTGTWDSERSFFHWSSDEPNGTYRQEPAILPGTPPQTDGQPAPPQVHAPFVIEESGLYHMFYRRPPGTIVRTWTDDPMRWDGPAEVVLERNDARDVHVLRLPDGFRVYYCQFEELEGKNRSCIFVRRSPDLRTWGEPELAFVDLRFEDGHSKLESPCVIGIDADYYLFMRDRHQDDTTSTVVLHSTQPDRFDLSTNTWLCTVPHAHALEVIKHGDAYYALRVSGAAHANRSAPEVGGWVDIAEVAFE